MTTASLKTAFDMASDLPEAEQEKLAQEVIELLERRGSAKDSPSGDFFSRLDSEPAFRDSIGAALEEGEKDVAAGRVDDLETAFDRIEAMARDRGV